MDLKEMSFGILIILVTINALYLWSLEQDPVKNYVSFTPVNDLNASSLSQDVKTLQISTDESISTALRLDLLGFIQNLAGAFSTVWQIVMKLAFGWLALTQGILDSVGLGSLALVFQVPLLIIQLIGAFYFVRDFINTVRGVG